MRQEQIPKSGRSVPLLAVAAVIAAAPFIRIATVRAAWEPISLFLRLVVARGL